MTGTYDWNLVGEQLHTHFLWYLPRICHIQNLRMLLSRICFIATIIARSWSDIIACSCCPPMASKNFVNNHVKDSIFSLFKRAAPNVTDCRCRLTPVNGARIMRYLFVLYVVSKIEHHQTSCNFSDQPCSSKIYASNYYHHPSHKWSKTMSPLLVFYEDCQRRVVHHVLCLPHISFVIVHISYVTTDSIVSFSCACITCINLLVPTFAWLNASCKDLCMGVTRLTL